MTPDQMKKVSAFFALLAEIDAYLNNTSNMNAKHVANYDCRGYRLTLDIPKDVAVLHIEELRKQTVSELKKLGVTVP